MTSSPPPSPTSQALNVLLSHDHQPPPAKLTHLAHSLLAQSRLRAPHLKPEEEIARPYACAEIACRRLRVDVDGRRGGGVPCPPRVYGKLVGFLEGILEATGRTQEVGKGKVTAGRARRKVGDAGLKEDVLSPDARPGTPGDEKSTTPGRHGTTKSQTFLDAVRKGSTSKAAEAAADTEPAQAAPKWIKPLIRQLCTQMSTPRLPPHVYAGVCVVLKLATLWPPPRSSPTSGPVHEDKEDIATLVIAIYLLVLTRMQRGDMTTERYEKVCGLAIRLAELDGGTEKTKKMIESWIQRLHREGWCEDQEWWAAVPEEVIDVESAVDAEEEDDDDEEDMVVPGYQTRQPRGKRKNEGLKMDDRDEQDRDGALLPGLGTMMQDAVDWLSEERSLEYLAWKEGIMKRIKILEKETDRRDPAGAAKKIAVR